MYSTLAYVAALSLPMLTRAQIPAINPDWQVVESDAVSGAKISFKEIQICERTSGVKSYSGFVNLPGSLVPDVGGYDINMYFLYFQSRQDSANSPLGIYLAGGPGEASSYSALASENGPCYVNTEGTDTIENEWSFNNFFNMLYLDNPLDAGYSYSELYNGTSILTDQGIVIDRLDFDPASPPPANLTAGYGTFPDQSFSLTPNNTVLSARALWHVAEVWMSSFPEYKTSSKDVSIIGNSWGGYYVPELATQMSKNLQNLTSDHPLSGHKVDSIGINNGCVDQLSGILGYPEFAYNNTYGVKFANETEYETALTALNAEGGCSDMIKACRAAGEDGDPDFFSNNATVNQICTEAFLSCSQALISPFTVMNEHNPFDVAQSGPQAPCDHWLPVEWYLNNATIQTALGAPLNWTYVSNVLPATFGLPGPYFGKLPTNASSGDAVRQNGLPNIEYLLANDVKVAFIFGDRDFRCPWTGGELTALAAEWSGQQQFAEAGYEVMQDQNGLKALVKQAGRFSFTRVMDAGHAVSAYAPETVAKIMQRTIGNVDVVTGKVKVDDGYATTGPRSSVGWRNEMPATPPETCMVAGNWTETNPWGPTLAAMGAAAGGGGGGANSTSSAGEGSATGSAAAAASSTMASSGVERVAVGFGVLGLGVATAL